MRYYKLWIYACNAILFVAVIVFISYAIHVMYHPWLQLLPTLPAYHPAMLYGSVAIVLQGGVLQAIGCIGALSLSRKLLTIYWRMILGLLLGDIIIGVICFFGYINLANGIVSHVKENLQNKYNVDPHMTRNWDHLQIEYHCCGVAGVVDYNSTWWEGYNASSGVVQLPNSCCTKKPSEELITKIVVETPLFSRHSKSSTIITCPKGEEVPNNEGCAVHLEKWLMNSV
ncbi:unnamed protein product, partial [Meganyctiphanes norvegica]